MILLSPALCSQVSKAWTGDATCERAGIQIAGSIRLSVIAVGIKLLPLEALNWAIPYSSFSSYCVSKRRYSVLGITHRLQSHPGAIITYCLSRWVPVTLSAQQHLIAGAWRIFCRYLQHRPLKQQTSSPSSPCAGTSPTCWGWQEQEVQYGSRQTTGQSGSPEAGLVLCPNGASPCV